MKLRVFLPGVAALTLAVSAFALPSPVATMAPAELHPGQHAVVHTVFRGDSIETFDAEIVGVLPGGRTDGDLILARATGDRLQQVGIAAGMSGSPVYVDGRLIGALSSGWSFTKDPLFGITPIGEMLDVLSVPEYSHVGSSAGPTGVELPASSSRPRFREFHWDEAADAPDPMALADLAPPGSARSSTALAPLPLPLAAAGLAPAACALLAPEFERFGLALTPGGRGGHAASPPHAAVLPALEPGSAIAVDLLRGDLQLSAIGTVTWREGDRVLIFGHPFFQSGEISLPLSTAEIVTIVASEQSSFKLGYSGTQIGVATQDRRAAVAGRLGGAPRLLPLSVRVQGDAGTESYRFETIEDRSLAPILVATATLNSIMESGGAGANQTLHWKMKLYRHGETPLELSDVSAGESPQQELIAGLVTPLRFLFANPFERLNLDSLSIAVVTEPGRALWTLRSARVLEPAVRPGGTVHVRAELERWRGGREWREFALHVPEEVPDGRYALYLGGGPELSRFEAGKLPGRYRPTSLADAWSRLAASRSSSALYAALYAPATEVTSDGHDYPELPLSALALLAGGQSAGDRARRGELAVLDEQRVSVAGAARGELLLQVQVDSQAP